MTSPQMRPARPREPRPERLGALSDHDDHNGAPFWIESAPGQPNYVSAGPLWLALNDTNDGPEEDQ